MARCAVQLSIVIVSWNTRDLLLGCLESIIRHPPARTRDVWVVDNASTDGSVEAVRVNYPQVHIISNAKNIGFAAANNQAIAASAGRYVLLLALSVTRNGQRRSSLLRPQPASRDHAVSVC
jgi:N-acetylglucosaminyl-diphospho-decaprenol L-rhamnosyltransferase